MEIIKQKIKAIIFDMDGTILETEHIWWQSTKALIAFHGVHVDQALEQTLAKKLSGQGMKTAVSIIKEFCELSVDHSILFKQQMDIAHDLFKNQQQLQFIKGFEAFHEKIRLHNIPSGLATNGMPEFVQDLHEKMNFEKFFGPNVYCIAHVDYKAKPDPALFLHTAKQLGVEPSECIVFEDSLPGFLAAQAAGMRCIAIENQNNKHLLDLVSTSISDYHQATDALLRLLEDKEPTKTFDSRTAAQP
ncbi:HAD family phosphatase [bacterium]|nr:HAD family phosphatase [bacterium]